MPISTPYITKEQMIQVDAMMIKDYHIELIQMMENAGRNLAALARDRFLAADPAAKNIVILAGSGGNGGGALVCARRLLNWGANIIVVTTKPAEQYRGVPRHQLDILQKMGTKILTALPTAVQKNLDLIIDGIIGYNLSGTPTGMAKDLIHWANNIKVPILSLDVPSGINSTTGEAFPFSINAAATASLALPKKGFQKLEIKSKLGELYLLDISVPPELYVNLGITEKPILLFNKQEILRLW